MNKSIRLMMKLVLLVGSALLSAPAVWAHDCGTRTVVLNPGGSDNRTINGITDNGTDCPTTYMDAVVVDEDLKKILTVTVEKLDENDAKVTFKASGEFSGDPVTGTVMVPWTTTCPEGQGTCMYTVTVGRPPNAFSLVQSDCSSEGSARRIYSNRSNKELRITIDAATTCKQEFTVRDKTETLENEKRTFELTVPSFQSIDMKCTGSGTCSYRIRGFVTARDINESCDFGPETIYENMTDKEITVTVEGTTSCPQQTFGRITSLGTEGESVDIRGGTRLFSFRVGKGESIVMFCTGATGTGKCNYILAGPTSGTRQSDQVSCGDRQTIYRNLNLFNAKEVTVQVTASCDEATLILDGSAVGEPIPAGATRARTFTVPPRLGTIELECSGRGAGSCTYTVIEGT
ncbi:MAG: hypothetical protein HY314_12700 [Acidobacteria bacterium]|nr:hypothetical protein [Acidobacteriota bacterium]